MQRWNALAEVPADLGPTAVTIGNFDGVHLGHEAVLGRLVERARQEGLQAVAITFDPHPLAVLYPQQAPVPLITLEHRLELLAGTGLDAVLVMEFTHELAGWSPERFVADVIAGVLHARLVVVGGDTRFGHRNAGDVETLRELGAGFGYGVEVVADLGDGVRAGRPRWSSTWVRDLVARGEVGDAAQVLGRPPRLSGLVVHGEHRGRLLGYPTANMAPESVGVIPADGVYAGWLVLLEESPRSRLPAAVSVGTNPTFEDRQRRVESYVLDRDDLDLYGRTVAVEFVRRLRATVRFDGVEALVAQIAADVEECRQVLGVATSSP